MCNRFRSIHAAENSARALQGHLRLNLPSGWNVAPTDLAPVVIGTLDGQPQCILARFGFTMHGRLVMNARSDKPSQNAREVPVISSAAKRRAAMQAVGVADGG